MKGSKLIIAMLLFLYADVHAQYGKCYTDEITQKRMLQNPQYALELEQEHQQRVSGKYNQAGASRATIITIPVVIHVVYNTASQNVSDAAIYSQINTLNNDFRRFNADAASTRAMFLPVVKDVEIEFCLASVDPSGNPTNGITRTQTTKTEWDSDSEGDDMKFNSSDGKSAWNPSKYLNIWVVNLASNGVAGYAYIGGSWVHGDPEDGIVLDYQIGFGANDRTLTHEVGHYLGLRHVWGNQESCNSDDGFSDTPNAEGPNYVGCNSNPVSCGTQNQFENYMDYSNCQNMFTIQQGNAMRSLLSGARSSLLTSNACSSLPVANFRSATPNICLGSTVTIEDISVYQPVSWSWSFTGGTPAQSTAKNPVVTYPTQGNYPVQLIVTNSYGSDTIIKNNFIKVYSKPNASLTGTPAACGADNGAVSVNVTGGSSPYVYSWSTGLTTQNLTDIPIGTYSVTVSDKFNCTTTGSATVTEQNNLQVYFVSQPDSAGSGKGSASIGLTGGTPPYSYVWNDEFNSTAAILTGLTAGTYTVTATDAVGCELVKVFNIGDVAPVTGISLQESLRSLEVFPNPAQDMVNVVFSLDKAADIRLELFSSEGKLAHREAIAQAKDHHAKFDAALLSRGVYYLRITSDESSVVRKVVLAK